MKAVNAKWKNLPERLSKAIEGSKNAVIECSKIVAPVPEKEWYGQDQEQESVRNYIWSKARSLFTESELQDLWLIGNGRLLTDLYYCRTDAERLLKQFPIEEQRTYYRKLIDVATTVENEPKRMQKYLSEINDAKTLKRVIDVEDFRFRTYEEQVEMMKPKRGSTTTTGGGPQSWVQTLLAELKENGRGAHMEHCPSCRAACWAIVDADITRSEAVAA